ncbi:MAG: helix-turn-helix domain-containing protein [Rhizobiales bacterium]|nr:helix-turn-helix domain-containing protein [Hyphomicrobiales bacterium]
MIADPHPEDIKAMIRKRGLTLEALSQRLGYSRVVVGVALRRPWPAVEAGIAPFLGVAPAQLWPDRYDATGQPRRNAIRRARPRLRQKAKAA